MRKICCVIIIALLAPFIFACPSRQEEGTGIERGKAKASKKNVRLELKLEAGKKYNAMVNVMQDAQIEVQALGPKGTPVTSRTSSVTATNFRRSVLDEGVKDGKLLRIMTNESGVVDRTQETEGKTIRRTLILENGKVRAMQANKEVKLTPDEAALGTALAAPLDYYVDKQGVITRDGAAWTDLAKAQSTPMFPFIDIERIVELALELPKDKVAIGETWKQTVGLPIGVGASMAMPLQITSTLVGVSKQDKRQDAQIQVQIQGASAKAIQLSGEVAGSPVKTKVDSVGIAGQLMVLLDLNEGRFMNITGELELTFSLNSEITVGGKTEKLRVKVDGAKIRVNEDYLYDLTPGGPPGKGQVPPPRPSGK